ncbi:hypothetical protein POM88_000706 [Heracleum sosnowskyi]|uniref:FAD linked oxidase N-terminal domain-containing protein n=1 Tax=Heracleum sosnowskyi TaxID=360622 RepID=A0AAD8NA08_9APIA|nr:hypothetical protein POM88_000706 [Heracleum sosnowskyi]
MKIVTCLLLPIFALLPFSILASQSNARHQDILQFNQRFAKPETPKPLLIVTPKEESQIQNVIHCSKKHDIQMRIRGGDAIAMVQSGATGGELYYAIAQKSNTFGFTGPTFSSVGIAGFVGHGGYGALRRKYGLAADNIIDICPHYGR